MEQSPLKSTAWEAGMDASTLSAVPIEEGFRPGPARAAFNDEGLFLPKVDDLPPSQELLDYYRRRLDSVDTERAEQIDKLQRCAVAQEQQHRLQWELLRRMEEIKTMQQELSDAKVFLFDERKYALSLFAENDRLKIQEQRDRKKVHKLMSLLGASGAAGGGGGGGKGGRACKHEISYFHDHAPALMVERRAAAVAGARGGGGKVTPPASPRLALDGRGPGGHKVPGPLVAAAAAAAAASHRGDGEGGPSIPVIPRVDNKLGDLSASDATVGDLATADRETLLLTIQSLKTQVEEQKRLSNDQVSKLLEDRQKRNEEFRLTHSRDEEQIQALAREQQKLQRLLFSSTKEYMDSTHKHKLREREILEEMEHHKLSHVRVEKEKKLIQDQCHAEMQNFQRKVESRADRAVQQYRQQALRLQDELTHLKTERSSQAEVSASNTDALKEQLDLMKKKYKRLAARRAHEIEGYTTDVSMLRDRLKKMEKQLHSVVMAVTKDADEELSMLDQVRVAGGKSAHMAGEVKQLKSKIFGIERELHRAPGS